MPDAASRFLEQMPEPAGLLLLDTQNRPVAWIPMDASEMTKLRTGDSATGAARIMRALERSNASNLLIKLPSDSEAAIENLQKFTNAAYVNLLDAIVDGQSRAAPGPGLISGVGRHYSRVQETEN